MDTGTHFLLEVLRCLWHGQLLDWACRVIYLQRVTDFKLYWWVYGLWRRLLLWWLLFSRIWWNRKWFRNSRHFTTEWHIVIFIIETLYRRWDDVSPILKLFKWSDWYWIEGTQKAKHFLCSISFNNLNFGVDYHIEKVNHEGHGCVPKWELRKLIINCS
jgi:hypothetical protein